MMNSRRAWQLDGVGSVQVLEGLQSGGEVLAQLVPQPRGGPAAPSVRVTRGGASRTAPKGHQEARRAVHQRRRRGPAPVQLMGLYTPRAAEQTLP